MTRLQGLWSYSSPKPALNVHLAVHAIPPAWEFPPLWTLHACLAGGWPMPLPPDLLPEASVNHKSGVCGIGHCLAKHATCDSSLP